MRGDFLKAILQDTALLKATKAKLKAHSSRANQQHRLARALIDRHKFMMMPKLKGFDYSKDTVFCNTLRPTHLRILTPLAMPTWWM